MDPTFSVVALAYPTESFIDFESAEVMARVLGAWRGKGFSWVDALHGLKPLIC
jgi:hypothetical protein